MNSFKSQIQRVSGAKALWIAIGMAFVSFHGHSFDFRPYQTLDGGPFRTLSEEESANWSARHWSSVYMRDSQKAFTEKHGVATQDIASLYFGKSEFRATEIFQELYVDQMSEFYNPLLRTALLRFSLRYNEVGVTIGGCWDMPVVGKTGRLGVRVSIPFKKITVKKNDMSGVRMGAELQDVLAISNSTAETTDAGGGVKSNQRAIAVRMDFAEALVQSADRNPALDMTGVRNNKVRIGASDVNVFDSANALVGLKPINNTSAANDIARAVVVTHVEEGLTPNNSFSKMFAGEEEVKVVPKRSVADIMALKNKEIAVFKEAEDYKKLAEFDGKSVAERQAAQDKKASLWLIPVVSKNSDASSADSNGVLGNLEALSGQVTENVFEWFHDRGVDFEDYTSEGAGDLFCQFFFNNQFSDVLNGEVFGGFRAPTGGKSRYDRNPFKTNLGNGGHWEVNVGAKGSFSPNKYFTFSGGAHYNFVLSHVEERHAMFKDAQSKLGPKVDVDVKWEYFVANLDLNIAHCWASELTAVFGYQFDYKRKDKISFSDPKSPSWLGKVLVGAGTTNPRWEAREYELSEELATLNTDRISHAAKFAFSFVMTDWLEFFGGGSYVFAGKNTLRSTDAHLGFNVAF